MEYSYAAYYCEENIYRLALLRERAGEAEGSVVCVSNAAREVALTGQRAGHGPAHLVVWDYHVVYVEERCVYDLDSLLEVPSSYETYRAATFPPALYRSHERYAPVFSVIRRVDYLAAFSSDRSHMRDRDGSWRAPPPPWRPIFHPEAGNTLFALVDGVHPAVSYHGPTSPFQDAR